jgi:DNA-binding response OmpR family regulator
MRSATTSARRILYVEDHQDTFQMVDTFLFDFTLTRAATISDGLRESIESSFDLHLLDEDLPDGSGLDLCRLIRDFDPRTPILLCSETGLLTEHQALEAGAQGLVKKWGSYFLETIRERITKLQEFPRQKLYDLDSSNRYDALLSEYLAISNHLIDASAELRTRLDRDSKRLAQACNDSLKAEARSAYLNAGGTAQEFEILWPSVRRERGLSGVAGMYEMTDSEDSDD